MTERKPSASATSFDLPQGYVDPTGRTHRDGLMRPATARDETRALGDFRILLRPETLLDILLARVVVRLGSLERLDAGVFQRLAAGDRALLERIYREMNGYPVD